jgi:GT2 family glycosyltransferase
MQLTIVIVNWNSGDYLRGCLKSLTQCLPLPGWEVSVIIIDNASTDGSLASLSGNPTVIANDSNRGFGAACNQALGGAAGYVLLLNPDVRLGEDSLSAALGYMLDHPEVGIAGIQLTGEAGSVSRSCSRFPRPVHFLAKACGIDRLFPATGHFMREWDHATTRLVDHVPGAFFLIRKEVIDAIGGFDERFFVYLEDVDFSLRARMAGWHTAYIAGCPAFHAGGGSSRNIPARRLFYSLRSRIQYGHKHYSMAGFALLVASTLLLEPLTRFLHLAATGRSAEIAATAKAYGLLFESFRERSTRAR